jgi:DNA-directed RNA polymerase subunit A'
MTVPMTVTPFNLEVAKEYVRRGSDNHPGANYVKRPDGRRLKVTDKNSGELADALEVGWKIDRQLKDGDIVLFNRQPSLHRMSIMGHFVKVMPHKTFRLNPAVCAPYNADFDGDEMNLHVPQNMEAMAEARILMLVEQNILSPRFGGPIIGGLHDHISGIFLLTKGYSLFTENESLDISRKVGIHELPDPAIKKEGVNYWTGKQIFGLILPKDLDMNYKAKICENCEVCKKEECEKDAYVLIQSGVLKCGTIDEKAIGAFSGKIVDRIVKTYDDETARHFIDNVTRLAIRAIMRFGFSFGISDADIPREAKVQTTDVILDSEKQVRKLIEAYDAGELEALPGRTLNETLEMRIMQELAKARDAAGSIAGKHLASEGDNSAVIMARSGARGSFLNLTQMTGCVGQQSVRGERIMRGYSDRTLPHFQAGDLGADARGFVESSYKKGLNPTEFFFHAMGGREGLVDTAVRTSQSGYLQRRLVNALQDLEVKYDGTVRETRGVIVQFTYGEDGVDPMKSDYGEGVNVQRIVEQVMNGGESK